MTKHRLLLFAATLTLCLPTAFAPAHGHTEIKAEDVQIIVQQIGENIYFLQGQGGNVAASVGKDGVYIIDSDYTEITPTLIKAIKTISDQPIKYLINTHWHSDHTGGNEYIGQQGTIIMAHENVRKHLKIDNYVAAFDMKTLAAPEIALPSLTFNQQMSVHMNGEDARLIHLENAHTDSDIIIHFPNNNIIHTGDIFFNGFYPFIDVSTGGTMDGMIAASETILNIADEHTKIIPGHGPLATKADLKAFHDMLISVRDKFKPLIDAGKTVEEIAATKPLEEFNTQWGDGFLPADKWIGIVYDSIKPKPSEKVDTAQ